MNTTITSDLKKRFGKLKLQESYAGLVLGAIIVIVLGLLVANYFSRGIGQIGTGETTSQSTTDTASNKRVYKVASGDSLSLIADKVYGNIEYWPVLAKTNNIANPNIIYADTNLVVPPKAEAEKLKAEMTMTSYQVQAGDTLFDIAQKAYADGSKWQMIAGANNIGYLPNGNPLIFAGSTLLIPR